MALVLSLERQLHTLLNRTNIAYGCLKRWTYYKGVYTLGPFARKHSTIGNSAGEFAPPSKDDDELISISQPRNGVRNARSHPLVDITDESDDVSQKVLTQTEFLQAKQKRFVTKEEYDNLKPHEVRRHLKATMKPEDLELKYGKKRAKKIIKRKELAEHAKVNWNPRERVAETNIKELSMEDIDIERRPQVEKFHFLNKSVYDMTEDEFYSSFFRDRERQFDGLGRKLHELEAKIIKEKQDEMSTAKRTRIAPKSYWIKPNYVSPTVQEAVSLNSMNLRFVMMNEARKTISEAAINTELWDAFLKRIMEISQKVCVRTLLRFLQIVSKVQLKPSDDLKGLVNQIHRRRAELKPKHYVFLFQALSRLRLRDQRLYDDIYEMVLCWPVLRNNFIIKASNAIAKLGIADTLLLQPLRQVIAKRLDSFSASDCSRVKAITVLELFTDDMIVPFLNRCEFHRQQFRHYSRHLEIIELYLRLLKDDVYQQLDDATKQFLIDARQNTLDKHVDKVATNALHDNHFMQRQTDCEDDESGWDDEDEEAAGMVTEDSSGKPSKPDTSALYAGPFVLDIYEPRSNTVIEINTEHQYYHGTTKLTATARRRHEIIAAMGFRLLHIPYRWWRQLQGDEPKVEALRQLLQYTP
ncbi:hypothetical protein X943_000449 [Babesia divergens]|uniref:RAP domain-containing protein n=1 Tax=Babesia divergens TaxID=32595 RepID=A0AAD9G8X8_BABDI|nr:hypothetical protein X943_000449 [Babesia divergens]